MNKLEKNMIAALLACCLLCMGACTAFKKTRCAECPEFTQTDTPSGECAVLEAGEPAQ